MSMLKITPEIKSLASKSPLSSPRKVRPLRLFACGKVATLVIFAEFGRWGEKERMSILKM